MKRHRIFHESYFTHSCEVEPEEDVLDTDIAGKGVLSALRRWWHDLFLLSYNDQRCRVYYKSSQAMVLERRRQFRFYRGQVHPISKFINFWRSVIICVLIINSALIRLNTSFYFSNIQYKFVIMGAVLEFIIIFDIFVALKTGYIDHEKKQVVLNSRKCRIHFASTLIFVYVMAALPLQTILLIHHRGCVGRCGVNKLVCVIRVVSSFSLLRIYNASSYLSRQQDNSTICYFQKFLRIFLMLAATMVKFLQLLYTVAMLQVIYQGANFDAAQIYLFSDHVFGTKSPTFLQQCVLEFSNIAKALQLYGIGINSYLHTFDIICGMVGFFISGLFYMWAVLECYELVNEKGTREEFVMSQRDRVLNLLRSQRVPDEFGNKIHQYYDFNLAKMIVIETKNDLYGFLPHWLRCEMKISALKVYLRKVRCFAAWPSTLVDDLVLALQEEVYLAGDVVAPFMFRRQAGKAGDGLAVVRAGVLAVYSSNNEEQGHILDGDYFGELSLVTDNEVRTSKVVAVTTCLMLVLYKTTFRMHLRHYPELFHELRKELREQHTKYNKNTSDNNAIQQNVQRP